MPADPAIDTNAQQMVMWGEFFKTLGQSLSDSAFWVGFILVVFFALSRFAISKEEADDIDPPLVARSFTTRFRYYLSATAYVGYFEIIYVILVGIGSFPILQELLEKWIGSLQIGDSADQTIGSPAWAALVTTSLLPSVPGFRTVDQKIRGFLHRFASIPHKARALAQEVLSEISKLYDSSALSKEQILLRQRDWLKVAVEKLQDGTMNPRNSPQYSNFFSHHRDAYKRAVSRGEKYVESVKSTQQSSSFLTSELSEMVRHLACFLSCALLQIEPSEREVRKKIRTRLELEDLPYQEFAFSLKQIIIGIIITTLLTITTGLICLKIVLGMQTPPVELSPPMVLFIFGWIPYAALMLVPPFILAAGVQLYFMDRRHLDEADAPWEDKFLVLLSLFVGTFFLGVLPPMAGMAFDGHTDDPNWLLQVLPFGLAPGLLSVAFYGLVNCCPTYSRLKNAGIDFVAFASIAGLANLFSTWIATDFGLNISQAAGDPSFTNSVALIVFPITAAVLVGTLGAIQCAISRYWDKSELFLKKNSSTSA